MIVDVGLRHPVLVGIQSQLLHLVEKGMLTVSNLDVMTGH